MTNGAVSVTVKLFSNLRRFVPMGHDGRLAFSLPAEATVADVLERIGIPPEEEITIAIGEELAGRETVLEDGDEVTLIAPMEGGAWSSEHTKDYETGNRTHGGGSHDGAG